MDSWKENVNCFDRYINIFHSLFFIRLIWNKWKYKEYFDNIESQPLTELQRESILLDEKRNLIVAGAGTGKTSTIIGKIGYLIKSKKSKPSEILTLAYNRSAANELKKRIKERINLDVEAQTFHSLCYQIIGNSNDKKLKISKFVGQESKFDAFLSKILEESIKDLGIKQKLMEFFSYLFIPYKDERSDFSSMTEYNNWIKSIDLITLGGERVKSYGEYQIANFLFVNGIKYEYERYWEPKKNKDNKDMKVRYRPDFWVQDSDVYIEYFGIDEDGSTAPYIDQEEYNKQIKWKRMLHEKGGTKLIQIYYYEIKNNKWKDILSTELDRLKVESKPLSNDHIINSAIENGKNIPFIKLISQFLEHYKSNMSKRSLDDIRSESYKDPRTTLFIDIFEEVFDRYQNYLKVNNEIDFNDMINYGSRIIKERDSDSKWKYILVDEYQDISQGRYNLINSMTSTNKASKLFCVGDDWQSIYRFAGSDVSLMKNFSNYFGKTNFLKLDKTFRFDNQISRLSEKFILKNPNQIKKSLKTLVNNYSPSVFLQWSDKPTIEATYDLIEKLSKDENINKLSIQIMARYNHNLPDNQEIKYLQSKWKGKILQPKSIHALKGLEADLIILTDLNLDGDLGFPSAKEDDPILEIVLSSKENFPHAEERRLFYVAITRSKKYCYLISNPNRPSEFVSELIEKELVDVGYITESTGNEGELIVEKISSEDPISNIFSAPKVIINDIHLKIESHHRLGINRFAIKLQGINSKKYAEDFIFHTVKIEKRIYEIEEIDNKYHLNRKCPQCKSGYILEKKRKDSAEKKGLYGCSNFPSCDYVGNVCDECNCYLVKLDDSRYICENEDCKFIHKICRKCNKGIMRLFIGKYGKFMGCSQFIKTRCSYREPFKKLNINN